MLSIGATAVPAAAATYLSKDDYYTHDEQQPSAWAGQGAMALGLDGPVEPGVFQALLEGHVPGSDQRLGTPGEEGWRHRAGWDLTFSAPKSVSILAEVGGDARLVAAHDAAVRAALGVLERDHLVTRVQSGGEVTTERTGSLVAATFRHDLSRAHDPQLHTHAVVLNATETARGWRSIESKPLYDAKMDLGLIYRQELALRVRELGYAIELRRDGTFEIRGVEPGVMAAFSTRRAEIEAKLAERGVEGPATAAESARAALVTRRRKEAITREAAAELWRGQLDPEAAQALDALQAEARERARTGASMVTETERTAAAERVLAQAVETLGERDAAFSRERTLAFANRLSVGQASGHDVQAALTASLARGDTLAKTVVEADRLARADRAKAGLTTERLRAVERAMIALEAEGRGQARAIAGRREAVRALERAETASAAQALAWTDDQRRATLALLTSRNRVHGVQGLAGTAKTTTVLATYAAEARRAGKDVRALGPTASAAETLGRALGRPGATVDRLLIDVRLGRNPAQANRWGRAEQVWIVDEASMLGAAKLRDLLRAAGREDARVVLVGDVRQLGSVEAGAGFAQLQKAGMATERLERIVRQTRQPLRQAVEQAAAGQAAAALGHFARTPGALVAEKTAEDRYAAIADRWLALSPADRAGTLIVEPSREGRARISAHVRDGLIREGALDAEALPATRYAARGLTTAEKKLPMSYDVGDRVAFQRAYGLVGGRIEQGEMATVLAASQGDGVVRLGLPDGRVLDWSPARKGAAKVQVYAVEQSELRAGDRIVWARNDRSLGLANGAQGEVTAIDAAVRAARVRFADGVERSIALDSESGRHWRHDYAQTAHAAQGRTADRVIVHAESHRINLVNERSFYVAISRAREGGVVVTDNARALQKALATRAGAKETALDAQATMAAGQGAGGAPPSSLGARLQDAWVRFVAATRDAPTAEATAAVTRARGPEAGPTVRRSLRRGGALGSEADRARERDMGGADPRDRTTSRTAERDPASIAELAREGDARRAAADRKEQAAGRGFER
jgi:conjugative relaxase-like TrwC/TraI family protein